MSELQPHHRSMLEQESSIEPDVIAERGYFSVQTQQELLDLGFDRRQAQAPGLVVPVWGVTGRIETYQLRSDRPRGDEKGRPIKYETRYGDRMTLDVHPRLTESIGDPSLVLWITEGAKKADSLVSRGICAIALLGVWNWIGENSQGGKATLADWRSIAVNRDRRIVLAFDSDVLKKPQVNQAIRELKQWLENRDAQLWVAIIPEVVPGKTGIDDYLATGGKLEDLEYTRQLPDESAETEYHLAGVGQSGEELFLSDLPEQPPYLPMLGGGGFFIKGRTHLFAGFPKVGKTELLARQIADWGRIGESVAYLTEETTGDIWARRLRSTGTEPADWRHAIFFPVIGWPPAVLLEQVFNLDHGTIVVDTGRTLLQMENEADNSEIVRLVTPWIKASNQTGKTLIMVVHHRKAVGLEPGERIAGGNALLGLVDCAIEVERIPSEPRESYRRQVSAIGRYPDGAPGTLWYEWEPADGRFYSLDDPQQVQIQDENEEVLARLPTYGENGQGVKVKDLQEMLDFPQQALSKALNRLEKEGLARRDKVEGQRGHYWWRT